MAADGSWPILLLLVSAQAIIIHAQNPSESTPSPEEEYNVSTTPGAPLEETTDRSAARVEPYEKGDREQYDVIDVASATGTVRGKPKSGQTTRIYTTGEVDESFWLKHLGDDFKHAIHLQVGGTNEEYNRLINRTQNGVHEEVHHEYLPGAERPGSAVHPPSPLPAPRQSRPAYRQGFDNRAVATKQQYLVQQQTQQPHPAQQRYNYAHQHAQHYAPPPPPPQTQPQYPQHTPHRNTYAKPQNYGPQNYGSQNYEPQSYEPQSYKPQSYIINSSEDQLHAEQSNPSPAKSAGEDRAQHEEELDSFGGQLNFKSPFNDYGSRPTRDLTYLLYKRGL
ncbi:developmental and secondary metabolism regulator VEL1 [Drosophila teissieri]|uniref:developmental and secondary metabolism regulator VEL1 n=1 Tax=Drosophila teissieri TaxID=7243 RepID=UPI001CB9E75C|nr:developmental and secondary metabolism regulator VEL1 [Drosophila teissieri]